MQVLIDTNILYYLSNISINKKFNLEKFKRHLANDNVELSISYFTLFEVLTKFDRLQDKQNLHRVLQFLSYNVPHFCYDKSSTISYDDVYDKCILSDKNCTYYKKHLQQLVIKYFSDFLTNISLLLGGMYLYLLHFNQSYPKDEHYQKSILYINSIQDKLFEQLEIDISSMFNDYYNSDDELLLKKEKRKVTFYKTLEDLFKPFNVVYTCYSRFSLEEIRDDKKFNNLIELTKNDCSINLEDLKKKFEVLRGNKHFERELYKLYNRLYGHRTLDSNSDVYKFIITNLLKGENFDFNDIIDYVNLIIPTITTTNDILYLTTDKKWIRFLENNQSNDYYKNTLKYIKNFIVT